MGFFEGMVAGFVAALMFRRLRYVSAKAKQRYVR
jgi:hypothetical protein